MGIEEIERDWTELGKRDALWAVLTEPGKRHGKWTDEEFLATGIRQIGSDMAWLEQHGVSIPRDRALDFGCGAGRLTNALARYFTEVVGVDISQPMLQQARRLDRSGGRVQFVHRATPELDCFDTDSFDLVYTDRVLQHLPPNMARHYLHELLRVARPGGALLVAIPEKANFPLVGFASKVIPQPLLRFVQRAFLRYPAPMRMHPMSAKEIQEIATPYGGMLCDTKEAGNDPLWRHVRHLILMRAPAGAENKPVA